MGYFAWLLANANNFMQTEGVSNQVGGEVVEATEDQWQKLAIQVKARRMLLQANQSMAVEQGGEGVSRATWSAIERASEDRYRGRTLDAIDRGLDWKSGASLSIVMGLEFGAAPASSEREALYLIKSVSGLPWVQLEGRAGGEPRSLFRHYLDRTVPDVQLLRDLASMFGLDEEVSDLLADRGGSVGYSVAATMSPNLDPDDDPEPPAAAGVVTEHAKAAFGGLADLPPDDQEIIADMINHLRRKNGIT